MATSSARIYSRPLHAWVLTARHSGTELATRLIGRNSRARIKSLSGYKGFSAAHDRSSSKYEQLYKQWKFDRQNISKFLSEVDSAKLQSDKLGKAYLYSVSLSKTGPGLGDETRRRYFGSLST
jgi:hypothetical protein